MTEQDKVNLRRTIYLVIQSCATFEELVHKILKLKQTEGQEYDICQMLLDSIAMEK